MFKIPFEPQINGILNGFRGLMNWSGKSFILLLNRNSGHFIKSRLAPERFHKMFLFPFSLK